MGKGLMKGLLKKVPFLSAFLCCWSVVVFLFVAPLLAAPGVPANEEGKRLLLPAQGDGFKTASAEGTFTITGATLGAEVTPSNVMMAQGWHPASPRPRSPVQDPLCSQFLRLFHQKKKEVEALQPAVNLLRTLEAKVEIFSISVEEHRKEAEQGYKDLYAKAGAVKTMVYTHCLPFQEYGKDAVPELAGVLTVAINLPPSAEVLARIKAANQEVENILNKIKKAVVRAEEDKKILEEAKAKVLRERDELRMRKKPIREFIIEWYQRAPNCVNPSTEDMNRWLDGLKNRLPDVVEKDVEALLEKAGKDLDKAQGFRDKAHFVCYEYAEKLPALCRLELTLTKKADKTTIHPGDKTIYTYTLTNTGRLWAFSEVRLVDNLCTPLKLVSGDTANPGQLDPGETWTYTCEQTLPKTTTNMATAEALFKMKVLASHLVTATVKRTATATVTVAPDTTPPTVTAFALPTMWGSLQVPIRAFTATDDVAVTGYMVTDTPTAPTPGHTSWKPTPQTSFTFFSQGSKTLYAWAKDGAGNVSASLSASVVIQPLIEVPNVIGFMEHTARRKLADHNLTVGKRREMVSGSPTGTVISQNPTAHTPSHPSLVPPGTPVDILISRARATGPGTVPNVVGMTVEEAIQTITAAGYVPTNAGTEPSDLAVGLVCRQNPEWGQAAAPGTTVSFWLTSNVPKHLYLDPPRPTVKVGQQISFTVTLVMKDGSSGVVSPNAVQWDPGPLNQFTCLKPGKFIVWGRFGDAYGSATVTCEEDWSVPSFEPPLSGAGDRDARVSSAGPGDYTWYAFCNPKIGEVTYGQQLPFGQCIMAGPFPGPRTAYDWIAKNCSPWRCNTDGTCALTAAIGGEWKVLCGKGDLRVTLGKAYDPSRQMLLREGFLGEPDARLWAGQTYPNWICLPDGRPPQSVSSSAPLPRRGGRWAVVCDKNHGGISLTQYPDVTRHWIMSEGFLGEPDARLWTEKNCPSWRCNASGQCLKGVAARTPEGEPLETPPSDPKKDSLLGEHWNASDNHPLSRKPPSPEPVSPPLKTDAVPKRESDATKPSKEEWLSDNEAKALQKELWDRYNKRWGEEWCIHREGRKKKAGKGGRVNWSGCAEEPLRALKVLTDRAWWARTREKQAVVRALAACYDPCVMRDTTPQDRQKCYKGCHDHNPLPR